MNHKVIGGILWVAVGIGLVSLYLSQQKSTERTAGTDSNKADSTVVLGDETTQSGKVVIPQKPMKLADFTLTNIHGEEFTKANVLGKPTVFAFIFSRCTGTCSEIMLQTKKLHDDLAEADVQFITVTMDPEFDTVEQLGKYADVYEPDHTRWHFLTGAKSEVDKVIREGFGLFVKEMFGEDVKPGFEFVHTDRVVLVNPEGYPVKTYRIRDDAQFALLRRVLEGKDDFPEPSTGEVTLQRENGDLENLSAGTP
ncbi:MAG: SCO family protein [Planctomycetaceae bacterium]